jgi:hypothetical protein
MITEITLYRPDNTTEIYSTVANSSAIVVKCITAYAETSEVVITFSDSIRKVYHRIPFSYIDIS